MKKEICFNENFIFKIIENDLKNKVFDYIKTRFAPEPNGYLHIGHAKSIFLNFYIAKKYNGECNLRFDNTNPKEEKHRYINSIKNDINWLGFKNKYNITYSSNYFYKIFNFAIELINKGLAYVDELDSSKIKAYRGTLTSNGIDSPYRNRSIEENIYLFLKMKNGFFEENKICLRAKIDMKSKIILMRDPVLYRVKFNKHNKTIKDWYIYPTYDFSNCICDYLENITHSLCTLEFQDNKKLYNWILNNINIKKKIPKQYEFARLNLKYFSLSKRRLKILVKNKIVYGWNDPRMPTISGLKNKGYTSNSIKNFCSKIGITKKESNIKVEMLEYFIKLDLYDTSLRLMSVIDPLRLIIENLEDYYQELIEVPNYPQKKVSNYRKIYFNKFLFIEKSDFCECLNEDCEKFSIGKFAKLKYSYIIYAKCIRKDKYGNINIICFYYKNTLNSIYIENKKIKKIIHWVSSLHNIKSKYNLYYNLLNNEFPNKIKNILSIVNKNSLIIKNGFTEKSNNLIKNNTNYQLERLGYFYVKKIYKKNKFIEFNRIVIL